MAQSKSRIKSVEPVLKDGVHRTYVMVGKTFYEFIVEMENGDKGRAASTQNVFRFKVGEEVLYEHVEDPKHGDRLKSFTAVDKPPQTAQQPPVPPIASVPPEQARSDRYKEDPHKQGLIVAQSCLGTAVEWCVAQEKKVSTEDMLKIAWKLESWVYNYQERRK